MLAEGVPNTAAQEQIGQLADEVLASKEANFADKAQAYAIKGLWTQALQTYAEGLRPSIRRDYSDGLLEIIRRHPALKRQDSLDNPDPQVANGYYISALSFYTAHKYADAERKFTTAIKYNNLDARYFYYLGLTRLALDKPEDAKADFEQGAQLERNDSPGRPNVNAALERVQGPVRRTLDHFRP